MANTKKRKVKKLSIKVSELSKELQNDLIKYAQRVSERASLIDKQELQKYLKIAHSSSDKFLRVNFNSFRQVISLLVKTEDIENIFNRHNSSLLFGDTRIKVKAIPKSEKIIRL